MLLRNIRRQNPLDSLDPLIPQTKRDLPLALVREKIPPGINKPIGIIAEMYMYDLISAT